jgi:hypothetical protein
MVRKLLFVGVVLQATVSVAVAQNAKPTLRR